MQDSLGFEVSRFGRVTYSAGLAGTGDRCAAGMRAAFGFVGVMSEGPLKRCSEVSELTFEISPSVEACCLPLRAIATAQVSTTNACRNRKSSTHAQNHKHDNGIVDRLSQVDTVRAQLAIVQVAPV